MWFRRARVAAHRAPFEGPIVLRPVGHVRNEVAGPKPHGWERVTSTLDILPAHAAKLAGLEAYSHVIVVCYLDMAADAPEKPDAITLASGNRYGIFATRSQLRPNHLGVSVAELVSVGENSLIVRGLDAIDGTAVLDIKPYLPEYDAVPFARIPGA